MTPRFPASILVCVSASLMAGCYMSRENRSVSQRTIVGAWILESIADVPTSYEAQSTLDFDTNADFHGSGGCNRYSGTYATTGAILAMSAPAATRMLCPGAAMDQETRFFDALRRVERFDYEGDTLLLYSAGSEVPMRLRRAG